MKNLSSFFRKIIVYFFAFFLLLNYFQEKELVFAEEKVDETSAFFSSHDGIKDTRAERLKGFLKSRRSPMTGYSFFIIKTADQYDLDWKLIPAISGVESSFGLAIPANSFNAYGWNNGRHYFKSWSDGIQYVSMKLKANYIDRGAKTVDQIGPIYAESPTWASRVKSYMNEIEHFNFFPLQFSL